MEADLTELYSIVLPHVDHLHVLIYMEEGCFVYRNV